MVKRQGYFFGCATACALVFTAPAYAQTDDRATVQDIIVTAQKREENIQDVPIAVSALSADMLVANRITNVSDLTAITPNFDVRVLAGGTNTPAFAMRGVLTLSANPGQDRAISQYLDGVYIGAPLGTAFELPDLERIEVLRGPQGTLFGRNATGGAVSIFTRDPSGNLGVTQSVTLGNYKEFRSSTRVETPQWGPFSASISYTHDQRRGDIRNLAAGTTWDRRSIGMGVSESPKYLGSKNVEQVFAAVKFQPNDSFKMVYKFDYLENDYTPVGQGLTAFIPQYFGDFGQVMQLAYDADPGPVSGLRRPKAVSNPFTSPSYQHVQGHNLTTTLNVSEDITLKNILGYRKTEQFSASDLSGLGKLQLTPAAVALLETQAPVPPGTLAGLIGSPIVFGGQNFVTSSQWSDELQLNYSSSLLTLTSGLLYFHMKAGLGGPKGLSQVYFGSIVPNYTLDAVGNYRSTADQKSYAAYTQAEVHVSSALDIVGGIRVTQDKKLVIDRRGPNPSLVSPYNKTKASYLIGVNYRPADDTLLYAKYSTAFLAGGTLQTIPYQPETVKSLEGGVKTDLFDRRVRLNLALFAANYDNVQTTGQGRFLNPPRPDLDLVIVSQGDLKTYGMELEATVVPVRGLTLTSGLGYTHSKLKNENLSLGYGGALPYRPKWTLNLSGQYETEPLFGESTLVVRADASYRSSAYALFQTDKSPQKLAEQLEDIATTKPRWIINSRVALQKLDLGGQGNATVSLWSKNLLNNRSVDYPGNIIIAGTAIYVPARTYGIDLTVNF